MKKTVVLVVVLLLVVSLTACGGTKVESGQSEQNQQETSFPTKDIKIVVMQSAGGGFDNQIRGIVPYLSKHLDNTTVVVENMPGGGGTVAANTGWAAKPDGHTLLYVGVAPLLMEQYVHPDRANYKMTEFEWIGQFSKDIRALAVRADLPYKTWDDLVKACKEKPLVFASAGASSPPAIEGALLDQYSDLNFEFIHYPGSSDARAGFARKEAEVTILTYSSLIKWVEGGDANFICVFSDDRQPGIQGVPIAVEAGMPKEQYEKFVNNPAVGTIRAIAAPPGTPAETVDILRKAFSQAGNDIDFLAWVEKTGELWIPLDGEELQAQVRSLEKTISEDDELIDLLTEILD